MWKSLTEEGVMPNATSSKVAEQFVQEFGTFLQKRDRLQQQFVEWRFEMLEDKYRESGTDLDLDVWLIKKANDTFSDYPWPHGTMRRYSDSRVWRIIFGDVGHVLDQDGRGQFVGAFNQLLEDKGMRARLDDNGVRMHFIDVSRWKKPQR
jgi:hypothetical protein